MEVESTGRGPPTPGKKKPSKLTFTGTIEATVVKMSCSKNYMIFLTQRLSLCVCGGGGSWRVSAGEIPLGKADFFPGTQTLLAMALGDRLLAYRKVPEWG